jgi:hypothetical protein
MKKVYSKPMATFESFTLSSNISAGCAKVQGVTTNSSDYHSCSITQYGWSLFVIEGICMFVPKDEDLDKFCYDIPTSTQRIFGS